MVSPDSLSPIPSTYSATKTPLPQSPGPLACLVHTEETPENTEWDHEIPESAIEVISKWNTTLDSCPAHI
jgi:hypothetical protein